QLASLHRADMDERLGAVVRGVGPAHAADQPRSSSYGARMSLNKCQRFLAYGLAGWCSEIVSTGIRSRGRDGNWRLSAHTYLWMLPIYGVAAVAFEPAYDAARAAGWPWWQRAAAWTAGIY